MNVFEDLIVELKQENLLEQTVVDKPVAPPGPIETTDEPNMAGADAADRQPASMPVNGSEKVAVAPYVAGPSQRAEPGPIAPPVREAPIVPPPAQVAAATPVEQPVEPARQHDSEFFKKRAIAEVSSLQMVDHVLTGVEREYMKVVPAAFDDFNVKKALNIFLKVAGDENGGGHAEAEFALMHETQAWCSALAARDAKIPVSSLRQYCEHTKPALSSQAMLALARFYRNSPFSEPVRAKFDYIITRLFSRPTDYGRRSCLFTREEALKHVNKLYSEWSSISLYAADDDDSKVLLTALSFEDMAQEAENAANFDQLIKTDFFGRLRLFKESISELFFAPNVATAAIESNVRIGNAYVELLAREREKLDAESIQSKYGDIDGQSVSDATARTLDIEELLKIEPIPAFEPEEDDAVEEFDETTQQSSQLAPAPETALEPRAGFGPKLRAQALGINKWFLAACMLLVAASVGIYVWSNFVADEEAVVAGVAAVNVDVPGFRQHIKTSKLSNETLYVHLLETWDTLPKDKRQEFLQQVLHAGQQQGWRQVRLITRDGKNGGFASPTRLEVVMP